MTAKTYGGSANPVEIPDEDDSIDSDQLLEYQEEVEELGSFPDKVKINSLSMIAGDYAESKSSSKEVYQIIRKRLLNTNRDNMLPLVYLLDSILKNVKGYYIDLVQDDAAKWMPMVHQKLQDAQRTKLSKVWKTWEEFQIFNSDAWKEMGRCFDNQSLVSSAKSVVGAALSSATGITRAPDGSLILPVALRNEMQNILDELQKDMTNELDKVSLERLADINPDLLGNIKKAAEDNLRSSAPTGVSKLNDTNDLPVFFTETRSPKALERSNAWKDLPWDPLMKTHDIVSKLLQAVRQGTASDKGYSQQEAINLIQYYAAASAICTSVTAELEQLKNQQDSRNNRKRLSFPGASNSISTGSGSGFVVEKKEFTNEGVKIKSPTVIGLLYEIGLPFLSSIDGIRFRTEIELSRHLDSLFRRNQIEKSVARTEERGWYQSDSQWTGSLKQGDTTAIESSGDGGDLDVPDGYDPVTSTMPADENRDRCIICGINFKMFFDNEEGMYQYSNCREIAVVNDDATAESEFEKGLAHVSCWRGLGSPDVLTMDQILEDALHWMT